jgi:hypothetical protein
MTSCELKTTKTRNPKMYAATRQKTSDTMSMQVPAAGVSCCWVLDDHGVAAKVINATSKTVQQPAMQATDHEMAQLTCMGTREVGQKRVDVQTLDIRYCTTAWIGA